MDPDATLVHLRLTLVKALKYLDQETPDLEKADDLLEELVQHVVNLDAWLRDGGFLPAGWKKAQP